MALLPILCYPDSRLHTVAKPVPAVDARIKTLIADMLQTMYDAKGIGLAATQIDVHERLIVIDVSEERRAVRVEVYLDGRQVTATMVQRVNQSIFQKTGLRGTFP